MHTIVDSNSSGPHPASSESSSAGSASGSCTATLTVTRSTAPEQHKTKQNNPPPSVHIPRSGMLLRCPPSPHAQGADVDDDVAVYVDQWAAAGAPAGIKTPIDGTAAVGAGRGRR
eukprot:8720637-Pyramimonas_sp.AAC.1